MDTITELLRSREPHCSHCHHSNVDSQNNNSQDDEETLDQLQASLERINNISSWIEQERNKLLRKIVQKLKQHSSLGITPTTPLSISNNNSNVNSNSSKSGHSPKRIEAEDIHATIELNTAPHKKQKTATAKNDTTNRSPNADQSRVVTLTATLNSTPTNQDTEPTSAPSAQEGIARLTEDIFEDIDNLIDATMGKPTPPPKPIIDTINNNSTLDDYTPLLLKSRNDLLKVGKVRTQYVLAHEKKPRCMVTDISNNLMVTCGFDGTVRFWSIKRDGADNVSTLDEIFYSDRESLQLEANQYINSLAFDYHTPDTRKQRLALAVAFDQTSSQQLILYKNVDMIQSDHQAVRTQFINLTPHSATIKATCFLKEPRDVVVTAGADKKIFLWKVPDNEIPSVDFVHSEHTSELSCVTQHSLSQVLLSGGQDKRFVLWNIDQEKVENVVKMPWPVTSIKENPVDPNLLLLSMQSRTNQLCFMDHRSMKAVLHLGYDIGQTANTTQFITPDWSLNGNLVVCGSTEPMVNIWDVRYVNVEKEHSTIPVHGIVTCGSCSDRIREKSAAVYILEQQLAGHSEFRSQNRIASFDISKCTVTIKWPSAGEKGPQY